MTQKDEFYDIDKAFGEAFLTVATCATKNLPVTGAVEEAADRMFDIAFQQADPTMLFMCVNLGFNRFIEQKRVPPSTVLEHIKDAFARWQTPDTKSLDAAFGVAQDARGARSRWEDRMKKRAHYVWMDLLTEELSIEDAAAVIEDGFGGKDLKRSYTKHRRKVKSTN